MQVPLDLIQFEKIKYLPIQDILHLCKTSRDMYSICQSRSTWDILLRRDYGEESETPKETYMEIYKIRKMTDISVNLVYSECDREGLSPAKVIDVLENMGYVREEKHFVWKEELTRIKKWFERKGPEENGEIHILDFDPYTTRLSKKDFPKLVTILSNILPDVFTLIEIPEIETYRITMNVETFSFIYNFYQ